MPADALSQIAIFTLKITKRFARANEQRAQLTGALPTELTRRWSNLGSSSHGQLFRPYWGLWTGKPVYRRPFDEPPRPPTPTFGKASSPLLLRHITENSFLWRPIEVTRFPWVQFDLELKRGSSAHVCLRSIPSTLRTCRLYLKRKQEKQTNKRNTLHLPVKVTTCSTYCNV